jgi:hypothetical protein
MLDQDDTWKGRHRNGWNRPPDGISRNAVESALHGEIVAELIMIFSKIGSESPRTFSVERICGAVPRD